MIGDDGDGVGANSELLTGFTEILFTHSIGCLETTEHNHLTWWHIYHILERIGSNGKQL